MRFFYVLVICCFIHGMLSATENQIDLTPQQLEEWFEDDERVHPFDRKSDDGALVFLKKPPAKRTPYSRNILTIQNHSLQSGWVDIEQCHEGLDPVPLLEVVYRYKEMRGLSITRTKQIGKAWVEGQSIQLEDVEQGAVLCMQAEARILYKGENSRFYLRNGPYQRRFLDSYFPMHVSLIIHYPAELLYFVDILPVVTPGFDVQQERGVISINTWFEGKLMLELGFRPIS